MSERALRESVIAACLELNRRGLSVGKSGNIGVRLGEGLLITPTGLAYEALVPEDLVHLRLDGTPFPGQRWAPSSEWRFHCDLLKAHPEMHAVVHAHSPHATALACLRRGIPAFHYMVAAAGGDDIRCAEYATFGTAELSGHILKAMDGRRACLMANHGQVAMGRDLARAFALAEEVENLARQYLLALSVGEPVVLPAGEMAEVQRRFASYGQSRRT